MIANLLNTLLGLWLVYAAVLRPAWASEAWKLAIAGIVVIALALWARAGDHRKWQSSVNMLLGLVLLLLAGLRLAGVVAPLTMFWGVFWPGILVAVLALWSALYRPGAIGPA